MVPRPAPADTEPATTVEAMATATVALVRSHQPRGPYRLLGYSLGGIVALETGRLLEEDGECVSFLGVVDAFFDRRYWPGGLFIRASARRSVVHAEGVARPAVGPGLGASCVGASAASPCGWAAGSARRTSRTARPNMTVQEANLLAMARWRPRVFDGDVVLFATDAPEFGCDLADLWRPWLPRMRVRRIPRQPSPAGSGARRHRSACDGRRRGASRLQGRLGLVRWSQRPSAGRARPGSRSSCMPPAAWCRPWLRRAARCTRSPRWSAATR